EQRDAAVGLDYLRARYLQVDAGRFYGRDPFEGTLTAPATRTPYVYVHADPVNFVDPSGQFFSIGGVLAAVNIQVSLFSTALPHIIFGIVRVGLTALIAKKVLEPAYRARDEAINKLFSDNGREADHALETIQLAQELIALGYRALALGLDAV